MDRSGDLELLKSDLPLTENGHFVQKIVKLILTPSFGFFLLDSLRENFKGKL